VIAIAIIGAAAYFTYLFVQWRKQQRRQAKQRELANFAPAVLNGDPLLDVVIAQGQKMESIADILRQLTADEINVFLPEPHRQRIRDWLATYRDNRKELR
jgi:hypothetical protein